MLYIGLDIHKQFHEVVILNKDGKPCGKSFKIRNTYADFNLLFERIAQFNLDNEPLRFGFEATGHYWEALYSHLQPTGHEIVILNPLRVYAFRKHSIRPVKNDRVDARCIAQIIQTHDESDYSIRNKHWNALRRLTRMRVQLVDMIADQKRRLLSILDRVFPEFEKLFGEKFCKSALAMLETYPTPNAIAEADLEAFGELLYTKSRKYYGREKAQEIQEIARNSFGSALGEHANRVQIQMLIRQIIFFEEQQKELDREITGYVNAYPNCLTTIAGIGNVLAGVILGEIGDIQRFKSATALVAYAGIDPNVMMSGQFVSKRAHLSKRGSKHLRRAMWIAAAAATRKDPNLKRLLKKKMDEGKHYHVALGAVANKLLHIIYAVLRDNKPYYSPTIAEAKVAA